MKQTHDLEAIEISTSETFDDGGPAFPLMTPTYKGMSLLDYFAGLAMQGLMSTPSCASFVDMAAEAYHMADVMLNTREAIHANRGAK